MEGKLKVAEPKNSLAEIQEGPPIAGFFVPIGLFDQILGYIGQGPWMEVNEFMERIKNSVQPIYAKNQQINETADQNTSTSKS